jgi:hypothetical protein
VEYANLSTAKFRAAFRIANRILFRSIASSKRLHARGFEALQAAAIRPNLDDRLRLLHGIS